MKRHPDYSNKAPPYPCGIGNVSVEIKRKELNASLSTGCKIWR